MAVHDWTRVDAGIFHAFHHDWITEISRALNGGILPQQYYALPEQKAAGLGPDVLALEMRPDDHRPSDYAVNGGDSSIALLESPPQVRITVEADTDYYRRKQNHIAVRHVSGDSLVAIVEIVSPGNKSSRGALRDFVEKAVEFLERQVHMLIIDLHPPTVRDPKGIHGAVWEELTGLDHYPPADEPLTLAAYESGINVRAYIEPLRVGGALKSMPLFSQPRGHVLVPLDETYKAAFAGLPRRWRTVLEENE